MKKTNIAASIALLACIGLAPLSSWAQPVSSMTKAKMLQAADNSFKKKDTYNALEWYLKVHDSDPADVDVIYKVALTYDLLRDYKSSVNWFKKLTEADRENKYPLARFDYAYALKLNAKYDECIVEFRNFQKTYTGEQAERYKTLAEIEIEGARWALKNKEPFEELDVKNMGAKVNSPSTEGVAFPVTRDRIIYSSLRADTIIYIEKTDNKFARIFVSDRSGEGDKKEWQEAQLFTPDILKKADYHVVHPTYSPDQKFFYYSVVTLDGNMLENSQIFFADNSSGTLANTRPLDFNSKAFSCKDPMVCTMDGKLYLFFTSNMPGGKGDWDIWYAEINADGSTKQPLNLQSINTIADDITPYFDHRDNTLYFSSKGYPGIGGYDIFEAKREKDGSFPAVKNMGPGFNTRVDDFGFVIIRNGRDDCYGYVVSNRPGTTSLKGETCCDDIFEILMPERCDVVYTVDIVDDKDQPLSGATVDLIDKKTGEVVETQTNKEGSSFTFNLDQGKNYEIRPRKDEFENTGKPVTVSTTKEAIGKVTEPVELKGQAPLIPIRKGLFVEVYDAETQKPLSGAFVGITDMKLNAPLADAAKVDNHRFEYPKAERDRGYRIEAKLQGYKNESRNIEASAVATGGVQKIFLTPMKLPIFYDVFFDFNKSNIRSGAQDTLDIVFATLNDYPNLVVEVRGHTDSIGNNKYNQDLSKRRAKSATDYLLKKGVPAERLIAVGLGEDEPVAPNSTPEGKDNPEGRQLNRRVELKIIDAKDAPKPATTATETPAPTRTANAPKDRSGATTSSNVKERGGATTATNIKERSGATSTTAPGNTQLNSQTRPKTTIAFDQKGPMKIGPMKFGEKKLQRIEFTNTGKQELVVEFIQGSCECTVIKDYSRKVAPGAKGFVQIEFDSKKAKVSKDYPSGIEILSNTEKDVLTLYSLTAEITN